MPKRISIYQYCINPLDPAENLAKVKYAASHSALQNSSLLVLPELCLNGYCYERIPHYHEYFLPSIATALKEIAKANRIALVGSFIEYDAGNYYNTFIYINAFGEIIHQYRKIHLFNLLGEGEFFKPGSNISTFQTDDTTIGSGICYDLRFPEFCRKLSIDGAEMIILPAEWPAKRIDHWKVLLKARAIENQVFVVGVNCTGNILDVDYGGNSAIIDPWGELITHLEEAEGLVTAEIDLNEIESVRSRITVWKDRKPRLYS